MVKNNSSSRYASVDGQFVPVPAYLDFYGYRIDRDRIPDIDKIISHAVDTTSRFVPAQPEQHRGFSASKVLANMNLPEADKFPPFVKSYAQQAKASYSLVFLGLDERFVAPLLPNVRVLRSAVQVFGGLSYFFTGGILRPKMSKFEGNYLNSLHYLSKLAWDGNEDWADEDQNLQQLTIYYIELFHKRFRDRNGTQISFDLNQAGIHLDQLQLSPAIAGMIFYVALEFLFDKVYRVPAGAKSDTELKTFTCFKANVITSKIDKAILKGTGQDPDIDYSPLLRAIVRYASTMAEKVTRSSIGGLIRGGGLIAVNNEVVAEIIAASASNLVKKATEKLTYEILWKYITDPSVGGTYQQKQAILDYLKQLHLD